MVTFVYDRGLQHFGAVWEDLCHHCKRFRYMLLLWQFFTTATTPRNYRCESTGTESTSRTNALYFRDELRSKIRTGLHIAACYSYRYCRKYSMHFKRTEIYWKLPRRQYPKMISLMPSTACGF